MIIATMTLLRKVKKLDFGVMAVVIVYYQRIKSAHGVIFRGIVKTCGATTAQGNR